MALSPVLSTQWAMEVPLCQSNIATAPVVEVPGDGACFQFRPLPEGTAKAGKSEMQQSSSASRCLVWQLQGGEPRQLLLHEVCVSEERRDATAQLSFASPLLPVVSCTESAQHSGTLVAVVSGDGVLHTIRHSTQPPTVGGSGGGLARQLQAPGAISSVPLAPHFQTMGAPTTLLGVEGVICVGTEEGNLVCLPAGSTDAGAAFYLPFTSGLNKVLGGFFGRPTGLAVRQLQELRFLDHRLLVAIHEGGKMRLWDLPTRRLVHEADLLPAGMNGQWVPSLARLTAEPLDASTSILLVYFIPKDEASPDPGMLSTYQIFLEQRGEGLYKVVVEGASRMQGSIHRLHDLVPENLALHSIGAWLLYDDAAGQRKLNCVALAFQDGPADSETHVQLMEGQLLHGCQSGEALQLELEAVRALEARLSGRNSSKGSFPAALASAFADVVVAPGRLSRPALHAALARLGSAVAWEEVLQADLAVLKEQLPLWVADAAAQLPAEGAVAEGAAAAAAGSTLGGVVSRWNAFLTAYATAWQQQHRPIALLQLPPQGESHSLLVARQGGMFCMLRDAVAPERAIHEALPADWQRLAAEDAEHAAVALRTAAAVYQAAGGGQLSRLLWACLVQGLDLSSTVLPAVVCSIAGGATGAPPVAIETSSARLGFPATGGAIAAVGSSAAAGGSSGSSASVQWRAACRKLPLQLARLCGNDGASFVTLIEALLKVLSTEWQNASRIRSPLRAATPPIRSAVLSTLAQAAWAQLEVLLQLALLLHYVLWSQTLALWSLEPRHAQQLESKLLPQALELARAAAVAYWAAVTPAANGGAEGGGAGGRGVAVDPADMVVSLRIGDGGPSNTAAAAAKRPRMSQGQGSYVAGLLLTASIAASELHVVRDLPDLQRISLFFSQRLLCLEPSPLHAAASVAGRQLQQPDGNPRAGRYTPDDLAVRVATELFAGKHTAQLAAMQRLLPDGSGSGDMRLLFFRACSRARQILLAVSPEEQQQLEEESCSLYFRVAAVFAQPNSFPGQAGAVVQCVQQLLGDAAAQQERPGSSEALQEAELRYYESLMTMYERMGRYHAAARCALAAAHKAASAMPHPEQLAARAQAQGRLWANVFTCMLELGQFEEAYVALLSNEVPEVQLDCLHRLLARLCAAPGGVELLCRLPFAQNLALVRGGRQCWVPMLEEVVATLGRRAAQLDLRAQPQPYKVLADFHISRSNFQSAAGALLAYARRLAQEFPTEPAMLAEAEQALAAAVSCLSLVEQQQAWVLDPAAAEEQQQQQGCYSGDNEDGTLPPVLTLAALQREHAIARGHAALAAAAPGAQQGTALLTPTRGGPGGRGGTAAGDALRGGDAEDVFSQLLALGLHDAAFQLAEAAFVGTQLTRALERVFSSLAAACVRQQLALWRPAGATSAPAGGAASSEGQQAAAAAGRAAMDTDETGAAGPGAVAGGAAAAAAGSRDGLGGGAAVADWRRLKEWLQRHEEGEHRFRLRLVILDALLRAEPAFMLPPWLMVAFKAGPKGGSCDLGGAVRVLMRHGRLADAAELAGQHLQAALHSVPSVGMARTSQVYFPQALLDELAAQLGKKEGMERERRQLEELMQRVRASAHGQSKVVEELFAH